MKIKIIIGLIKEYFESCRCKKKIRAIYGGDPPNHQGCEDVKKGVPVLNRAKGTSYTILKNGSTSKHKPCTCERCTGIPWESLYEDDED